VKAGGRAVLLTCFHAGILLGLFFDPEDGGDMFLRNVGLLSADYNGPISQKLVLSRDSDLRMTTLRMTTLARASSNCERQTHLLVREDVT
jgi:hypothetical protein